MDFIQNTNDIAQTFADSDKEELYNLVKDTYLQLNENVNLTHMYFIKTDGTVLLRVHQYDRDSDIVERMTFKKAQEFQSIYYGLEFGLLKNYTLRVVKPWYYDGRLIGYIELGKEIDKVISELSKHLQTHVYLAVNKDVYKDSPEFARMKIDNYYLAYNTYAIPPQMKDILSDSSVLDDISFKGKDYFVSKSILSDISGKSLGHFVFLSDVSLEHGVIRSTVKLLVVLLVIISSIFLFLGYLLIKNREKSIHQYASKMKHQTEHDALTGLPNRVLFNDRLEQGIEKAKRKNSKMALLFIDLDHFKEINDSLGHAIGDEVLQNITSRLKATKRDGDTLARLGGDEFTIILEDLAEAEDASIIAKNVLDILAKPVSVKKHDLYVSSSIGISIYPDDGSSAANLLKFADSAMYKAKSEGRNNFQYYSSHLTELAFERVVMEASLRVAIKNEEFVVFYQPQVNGSLDAIIGMEALVRWEHPIKGLVSPAKFIPLAESTGLIIDIDRLVMKNAMTQFSQWYKAGYNPGILSMNLAVKQLRDENFLQVFTDLIKETECKPEWLELEVTEGQIMTHPENAILILQKISDMGIRLAVDDFGTGYSSLAYLKKLPIDKLKIDQTFIKDLPNDEEDVGISKAVIALAKSLNLEVIAEGVETKEQRDFLVKNGCENIQGYFYFKPLPAKKLEERLKTKYAK